MLLSYDVARNRTGALTETLFKRERCIVRARTFLFHLPPVRGTILGNDEDKNIEDLESWERELSNL